MAHVFHHVVKNDLRERPIDCHLLLGLVLRLFQLTHAELAQSRADRMGLLAA